MTDLKLAEAIVSLRPGAQWTFYGTDLATLIWHDTVQTRPTDADILAAVESLSEES